MLWQNYCYPYPVLKEPTTRFFYFHLTLLFLMLPIKLFSSFISWILCPGIWHLDEKGEKNRKKCEFDMILIFKLYIFIVIYFHCSHIQLQWILSIQLLQIWIERTTIYRTYCIQLRSEKEKTASKSPSSNVKCRFNI